MAQASIKVIKAGVFSEGAGFKVRRTVGSPEQQYLDPWVLMDHFGPVINAPETAVGAPDHPHSGLEIISYFLSGGTQHHDTIGHALQTKRGESMFIHAGSGILHSEIAIDDIFNDGGEMEAFQIWYSLPLSERMGEPTFQKLTVNDYDSCIDSSTKVKVKVIAGKTLVDGVEKKSTAKHRWPVTYLDVRVKRHAKFSHRVEGGFTTLVYCYRGSLFVSAGQSGEVKLNEGEQAQVISKDPVDVQLRTDGDTAGRVLLLSAKPHGEPIFKRGGLVATSDAELEGILQKVRSGGFGVIPGAEERRKKTEYAKKKLQELSK